MNDSHDTKRERLERNYKTARLLGILSIVVPIVLLVIVPLI